MIWKKEKIAFVDHWFTHTLKIASIGDFIIA